MDFTPASIIAALFFGLVGAWAFSRARRDRNPALLGVACGLFIFPILVNETWAQWLVGLVLTALAYRFRTFD